MIAAIALALTTGIVFGTLIPTGLLGAAFVAQNRFRAAISRYVAIVGLLVTTMLASLSFTSVQVALGQRPAIPGTTLLIALAIFLYAMFGGAWRPSVTGIDTLGDRVGDLTRVDVKRRTPILDVRRIDVYPWRRSGTVKRISASVALLLTAFFAVAGSFHHHSLPSATHDHAGFCSAEVEFVLESCALCPVAQTSVDLVTGAVAPTAVEAATRLAVRATGDPSSAAAWLHRDPRAPPFV